MAAMGNHARAIVWSHLILWFKSGQQVKVAVVYLHLEGVIVSRNLLCDIKELFFYSTTY